MILTRSKITAAFNDGSIRIDPFDESRLSPDSYDLTLGAELRQYTGEVLDPRQDNPYNVIRMGEEGYTMQPGQFLIGHSAETIGSDEYVIRLHNKSGMARLGLSVHLTADLIHRGSHGRVAFHLYAAHPVILRHGERIAQVTFWETTDEATPYTNPKLAGNGKGRGKPAPGR